MPSHDRAALGLDGPQPAILSQIDDFTTIESDAKPVVGSEHGNRLGSLSIQNHVARALSRGPNDRAIGELGSEVPLPRHGPIEPYHFIFGAEETAVVQRADERDPAL